MATRPDKPPFQRLSPDRLVLGIANSGEEVSEQRHEAA